MCGICGFISKRDISENILEQMNDALTHRGPDDKGCIMLPAGDRKIGMAHRRLSIMDLSMKGHQPMASNDKNVIVVFNGEIYNFKEIRKQLEGEYVFCSNCDTEVILASYQKWGEKCFEHFDGMFAMAIYDIILDKLIIGRDRIGKKPLFYFYNGEEFVYASEMKAIMIYGFPRVVRPDILGEYLYHGYIQGKDTVFQDVYKLLPGSILVYENEGIREEIFWSAEECFAQNAHYQHVEYEQAKEDVKKLLENSVKKRLEADVPLGLFFSGGIDSTLVAAIMQRFSGEKIKTFTIGFDEKEYNEALYAKEIAEYLGTEHKEKYINEEDMLKLIQNMPQYFDEPVGDAAILPTLLLSQLAQPEVKVVLTGDGGDEFFCGYRQYEKCESLKKLDHFRSILPSKNFLYTHFGKITNRLYAIKNNDNDLCKTQWVYGVEQKIVDAFVLGTSQSELRYLIEDRFETTDWIRKRMLVDTKTTLTDCFLVKTDRATMAYSLEARCPLLDMDLIKKSYQLPMEYLMKKRILKDILADYVPAELYERPKHGFSVPIGKWLKGILHSQLLKFADSACIEKQGLFNARCVQRLIAELDRGGNYSAVSSKYLWNFYVFQLWYQRYVDNLWK